MEDLDTWWREQTLRTPKPWQVWRLRPDGSYAELLAGVEKADAVAVATNLAKTGKIRVAVLAAPSFTNGGGRRPKPVLRVDRVGHARGPWAPEPTPAMVERLLVYARRLAGAEDRTPLAALQVPRTASRLVDDLENGKLEYRRRSFPCPRRTVWLERAGKGGGRGGPFVLRSNQRPLLGCRDAVDQVQQGEG